MKKRRIAAASALIIMSLGLSMAVAGCGNDESVSAAGPGNGASVSVDDESGGDHVEGKETGSGEEKEERKNQNPNAQENIEKTPPQMDSASNAKNPTAPEKENGGTAATDADDSYFSDAVFIGDSLTEGFQLHGGITNATYYGFKNLNVKEVFEKPLVKSSSGKITISEALKQNSFGKYYIMLGANELGWVYPEVFTKKYGELIDLIKEKNPDAKIYLQSVLPVTAEASEKSKVYSNDRIDYYDELISTLASDKGVTFLNVRESVQNDAGILPNDAATDGVHLNKTYCLKWADYLRTNM